MVLTALAAAAHHVAATHAEVLHHVIATITIPKDTINIPPVVAAQAAHPADLRPADLRAPLLQAAHPEVHHPGAPLHPPPALVVATAAHQI